MLILFCFFFLLRLLKTEFAIVHNAADRWIGIRGNFDKIKLMLLSDPESLFSRHDAKLFTLFADQTNFTVNNVLIDLMSISCYFKHLRNIQKSADKTSAQ